MNRLKWIIQALSQPYEIQKTLFPDFVNIADELAGEWELALHELEENKSKLSKKQLYLLQNLDEYILSISGPENLRYWIDEALQQDIKWENLREMAKAILDDLSWGCDIPHRCNAIYIKKP